MHTSNALYCTARFCEKYDALESSKSTTLFLLSCLLSSLTNRLWYRIKQRNSLQRLQMQRRSSATCCHKAIWLLFGGQVWFEMTQRRKRSKRTKQRSWYIRRRAVPLCKSVSRWRHKPTEYQSVTTFIRFQRNLEATLSIMGCGGAHIYEESRFCFDDDLSRVIGLQPHPIKTPRSKRSAERRSMIPEQMHGRSCFRTGVGGFIIRSYQCYAGSWPLRFILCSHPSPLLAVFMFQIIVISRNSYHIVIPLLLLSPDRRITSRETQVRWSDSRQGKGEKVPGPDSW